MDRADLIELVIQREEEMKEAKKNYNKLYKEYSKYFDAYKERTKLPIFFLNKHFSVQAGFSAFLDPDNPLKSNMDFIFQGSFYNKWTCFTIGYQPINKNIFVMAGVFFPY